MFQDLLPQRQARLRRFVGRRAEQRKRCAVMHGFCNVELVFELERGVACSFVFAPKPLTHSAADFFNHTGDSGPAESGPSRSMTQDYFNSLVMELPSKLVGPKMQIGSK